MGSLIADPSLATELHSLVVSFHAYANFCEGNIDQAVEDIQSLVAKNQASMADQYNLELCLGVLDAEKLIWDSSKNHFETARTMNPSKVEPRFYLAVGLLFDSDTKHISIHGQN